jgi:hypothetical protein
VLWVNKRTHPWGGGRVGPLLGPSRAILVTDHDCLPSHLPRSLVGADGTLALQAQVGDTQTHAFQALLHGHAAPDASRRRLLGEEDGGGGGGGGGGGSRAYDVGQRSRSCEQHDWGTALAFKKFKGRSHVVDQGELERKLFYSRAPSVQVEALAAVVNPLLDRQAERCFGYPVRAALGLEPVDVDAVMSRSLVHSVGGGRAREGGQGRVGVLAGGSGLQAAAQVRRSTVGNGNAEFREP